jgi:LmbE family N-acetylglucosaminyl deacetylase
MNVLEHSSPLLIPVYRLSKSNRYDLKKNLINNLNYKEVFYSFDECKHFMDIWSDCNDWSWGNWYPKEELQLLHNKGVLKCFKCENIAYQFVLKWDRYIYCNSPIYDKRNNYDIEIGKFMWVKLIEYCIKNNTADYIDLMGPENLSCFGEVIDSRNHTSDKGDFGYKWKLVPKDIKNKKYKLLNNFKIVSDKNILWKGVNLPSKPSKLLIVAHPDDDAIFFGDWLTRNAKQTKVVCLTCSNDPVRFLEFKNSLSSAGVVHFECFEHNASLDLFDCLDEIQTNLLRIKNEADWQEIVTHNIYGEYGHIQHVQTHEIVKKIFDNNKIQVYYNSNIKSNNNKKEKLLDAYESQKKFCIEEIRNSECTGSDWYKHTVNKNMIDHESIIALSKFKNTLKINLIWTQSENHVLFDIIKGVHRELRNRGHEVVIAKSFPLSEADVNITFCREDSLQCLENNVQYFFVINDEMMVVKNNYNEYNNLIDKSIRSFVKTRKIRDELGDRLNLVWVPVLREWSVFIRKFESHIYMGLVSQNKI